MVQYGLCILHNLNKCRPTDQIRTSFAHFTHLFTLHNGSSNGVFSMQLYTHRVSKYIIIFCVQSGLRLKYMYHTSGSPSKKGICVLHGRGPQLNQLPISNPEWILLHLTLE